MAYAIRTRVSALRERPRCARHGRCARSRAPARLDPASPSPRDQIQTRLPGARQVAARARDATRRSTSRERARRRPASSRTSSLPRLVFVSRSVLASPSSPTRPLHGPPRAASFFSTAGVKSGGIRTGGRQVLSSRQNAFLSASGHLATSPRRSCPRARTVCVGGYSRARTPQDLNRARGASPALNRPPRPTRDLPSAMRTPSPFGSARVLLARASRLARAFAGSRAPRAARHRARVPRSRRRAKKTRRAPHGLDATSTGSRERPGRPRARLPAPSPRARKISRVTARRAFKFCPHGFSPPYGIRARY